jgi:polyisoprenoid-binding protein YceI
MIHQSALLLLLFFSLTTGNSQSRYFTKTGLISFSAGTSVEDVEAINKSVTSVFDVTTGQIEFAVLIKGFEFRRGLMQEHFNENYMESEKYPKSVFKGKFEDVSKINFKKDGSYPTVVKGVLDIHNVKKEVEVPGTIKVENGVISSEAAFKVLLEDFGIKIPGAVKDKISPTVEIHASCLYKVLP